MRWIWYLSNRMPSRRQRRRQFVQLIASAMLATTAAAAPSLRQVIVEFRIEPGSTLDQEPLRAAATTAAAEEAVAQLAREKFLFLEWLPSGRGAAPDSPRLVLQLADGPAGACDPPAVRARFSARRGETAAWNYRDLEFSPLCDLGAPEMTSVQLVAKVAELTAVVIQDADKMKALEEQFLSEIVLSKALSPDPVARKLYLPIKGLKAKTESEIEVRFRNQLADRLVAHPGDIEGGRTQLLLERFACAGIDSGPALNALPIAWHPRLQELLETCREPWVYMKVYKPSPLESEAGVVTTLEEGGNP